MGAPFSSAPHAGPTKSSLYEGFCQDRTPLRGLDTGFFSMSRQVMSSKLNCNSRNVRKELDFLFFNAFSILFIFRGVYFIGIALKIGTVTYQRRMVMLHERSGVVAAGTV